MIRRVVDVVIAVVAGVATVTALGRAVGEVPAWLAFVMGALVVIASLTQTEIRAQWRTIKREEESDDEDWSDDQDSVRGGRHRRDDHQSVRHDREPDTLTR